MCFWYLIDMYVCVCEREKEREMDGEEIVYGFIVYFSKWYLLHSGPLCYKSLTEGSKTEWLSK